MSDTSLVEIVQEDAPTLEAWLDRQDFEYSRAESEVVDYLNKTVDYNKLEDSITNASEIDKWGEYFEECGIEQGSDRATAAKKHIKTYVKKSS